MCFLQNNFKLWSCYNNYFTVISGIAPKWPVNDWTNAEGNEVDAWQQLVNERPETVLHGRFQLRY